MEITTRMEFDSGHRIPNHKSVCKNLHGHRYAIEVTVKGKEEPVKIYAPLFNGEVRKLYK